LSNTKPLTPIELGETKVPVILIGLTWLDTVFNGVITFTSSETWIFSFRVILVLVGTAPFGTALSSASINLLSLDRFVCF